MAQDAKSPYVEDPDPLVRQKLDEWQDLKLGLLMHWGTYSQWGIVESWSLCSEDEDWCRRSMDDYATYKTAYEKLQTTFNPGEVRSGALGEGRARRGHALRRVHDEASRRLQHVRHAPDGLPHHVAEDAVLDQSRAPTSPRASSTPSARRASRSARTSRSPTGTAPTTGGRTSRRPIAIRTTTSRSIPTAGRGSWRSRTRRSTN